MFHESGTTKTITPWHGWSLVLLCQSSNFLLLFCMIRVGTKDGEKDRTAAAAAQGHKTVETDSKAMGRILKEHILKLIANPESAGFFHALLVSTSGTRKVKGNKLWPRHQQKAAAAAALANQITTIAFGSFYKSGERQKWQLFSPSHRVRGETVN